MSRPDETTGDVHSLDEAPGLGDVYHSKVLRLPNNAIQKIGIWGHRGVPHGIHKREHSPFISRWSFNIALLAVGVFATAAGASLDYVTLCSFAAAWNISVGGNLPVDSAASLEFAPVALSILWAFGQPISGLIAWPVIAKIWYPCSENQGWKYILYAMSGLMIILWTIRFPPLLNESPKYLMGRGRDAVAIEALERLASFNSSTNRLTFGQRQKTRPIARTAAKAKVGGAVGRSVAGAIRKSIERLKGDNVKLFAIRKLELATFLLRSAYSATMGATTPDAPFVTAIVALPAPRSLTGRSSGEVA